jgi:hypothetical protein
MKLQGERTRAAFVRQSAKGLVDGSELIRTGGFEMERPTWPPRQRQIGPLVRIGRVCLLLPRFNFLKCFGESLRRQLKHAR